MDITLFATAWGPQFGGVNAFNQDFARGLATALASRSTVYCVVPHADQAQIENAGVSGVQLISLEKKPAERLDPDWVYSVDHWFRQRKRRPPEACWVGHDVITGDIALSAEKSFGGTSALIHHMSFISYQGTKHADSKKADNLHHEQEALFRRATNSHLFAVGPLLRRSCAGITGRKVTELVPGFPDVPPAPPSRDDRMTVITFGRMATSDDRIKQGRLAAAAFARAIGDCRNRPGAPKPLENPLLYLIGLKDDGGQEEQEVRALVNKEADGSVNILALPYDQNRDNLFGKLISANLAMMLSLHEGFGLTGWEAIAFNVPLIVNRNSGLYGLIEERIGGAGIGCLRSLQLRGPEIADQAYHHKDKVDVAQEIIFVAADLTGRKRDARTLKRLLQLECGCTWAATAETFLAALGLTPTPRETNVSFRFVPDDDWSLREGLARLWAHPPTLDDSSNRFPLDITLSLGSVTSKIPGTVRSPRLDVTLRLKIAAEVQLIERSEHVQHVPGTLLGHDRDHPLVTMQGGMWRIRVSSERGDGSMLIDGLTLCEMQAFGTGRERVSLELRCPDTAFEVIMADVPPVISSKQTAVLRRLLQRMGADPDADFVILARAGLRSRS